AAMGAEFAGLAATWVRHIRDVARIHHEELQVLPEAERFDRLVELNVAEQVYDLSSTVVLREAWAKGRAVKVHGWVYSLKDGLIKDLGVTRDRYVEEEGPVHLR